MSTATDFPKVNAASARVGEDGGVELLMHTVDGVQVGFLLDDMAAALFSLTVFPALQTRKARIDAGGDPIIYRKDNE